MDILYVVYIQKLYFVHLSCIPCGFLQLRWTNDGLLCQKNGIRERR